MVTTLDQFGRILIPKELRKLLGITPQTRLAIKEESNKIIIEPIPAEETFVEKDGILVFTGTLDEDFEKLLETERAERDNHLLQ